MSQENQEPIEKNEDFTTMNVDGMRVLLPKSKDLKSFATAINPQPGAIDLYEVERQRANANIPTQQQKYESLNLKRNSKGMGTYQIAIRAERMALREGLETYASKLGFEKEVLGNMVDYLPNARFAYLNKLIKKALEGIADNNLLITRADLNFVNTIWINQIAKDTLVKLLTKNLNPKLDGFSIQPTQSRSGLPIYDSPGIDTGTYIALRNPGDVYLPIRNNDNENGRLNANMGLAHLKYDENFPEKLAQLVARLDQRVTQAYEALEISGQMSSLLSATSGPIQKSILLLMDKLTDRHISLKDLYKFADSLQDLQGLRKSKYLIGLCEPFKHRNIRIPALISPPSATFTVRSIIPLTTNALGNVAFVFNPYSLWPAGSTNSTFGVNNNVALVGNASSNFFLATPNGTILPADFYVRYRLATAGLRLYCYPSSNNDNGIAVVSSTFEATGFQGIPGAIVEMAQFGDFNQIENGWYKQTTTVASRQVQEHVYFPLDEGFWDYLAVGTFKSGFAWTGYISGAAPSATIARVEVIMNFEAILDNQYTDYLPSDNVLDDVEPKQVVAVLNKMKRAETTKPSDLKNILQEENQLINPDDVIDVPMPPSEIKKKQKEFKDASKDLVDTIKDFLPSVPDRDTWMSRVLEFVSPVAKSIISSAVQGLIPIPGLGSLVSSFIPGSNYMPSTGASSRW